MGRQRKWAVSCVGWALGAVLARGGVGAPRAFLSPPRCHCKPPARGRFKKSFFATSSKLEKDTAQGGVDFGF